MYNQASPPTQYQVPVALFVFNRPQEISQPFRFIAQIQPRILLVIAGGPRPSQPADAWCWRLLLFCFALPCFAGCFAPISHFQVETSSQDAQVAVTVMHGQALVDIHSERGIGEATLSQVAGEKPNSIRLRLHLQGLEQLQLRYGTTEITVSISSVDSATISQSVRQGPPNEQAAIGISASSPFWMQVTIAEDDPRFELELPPDFLEGPETTFTVTWIDYFRGAILGTPHSSDNGGARWGFQTDF